MAMQIVGNAERGHVQSGWLKAAHSFSFGRYYNPDRMHFGALLVVNEDRIAPGAGFAEHFHDNMEIITIPLSGALAHGDSMGNSAVIRAGDVQIMSAGTGIMHSERNASSSEEVHLLQIWIVPHTRSLPTRYEQVTIGALPPNAWTTIAGPLPENGRLQIHQDAWVQLGAYDAGRAFSLAPREQLGAFMLVIDGEVQCGDTVVRAGDAMMGRIGDVLSCTARMPAKLLRIDVPMIETPE